MRLPAGIEPPGAAMRRLQIRWRRAGREDHAAQIARRVVLRVARIDPAPTEVATEHDALPLDARHPGAERGDHRRVGETAAAAEPVAGRLLEPGFDAPPAVAAAERAGARQVPRLDVQLVAVEESRSRPRPPGTGTSPERRGRPPPGRPGRRAAAANRPNSGHV